MSTSLTVIDKELQARLPVFLELLPPNITPQRLARTVMMAIERTPKLLDCTPQSIINAATTAAVLGLEVDGVTGQGWILPYGNRATFLIGSKGFNTIAFRAGYTLSAGVVREGDIFDYELGSSAFVRHKPVPGNRGRIVGAWATATSSDKPPIVRWMSIEEIEQIKQKSPGARKPDSPWNDLHGPGYSGMCEKTAKRRLARDIPMTTFAVAASLDAEIEDGKAAWLTPDGGLHTDDSAGPVERGTITDVQPEELLMPANPNPWPDFKAVKEFVNWSTEFFTDHPGGCDAWKAHFGRKLDSMLVHPREEVRQAATDLIELYEAKRQT
jgi:recombination protein RecT